MAITSAVCNSFKVLALTGKMDFTAATHLNLHCLQVRQLSIKAPRTIQRLMK